jgi:hypothetical protein
VGRKRRIAPGEIHGAVGAGENGRAVERHVGEILASEAMFTATGVRAERAGGNGFGDRTDEAGALDENHFGLGETVAKAGKDGDGFGRDPIVVAFEGVEAVGVGADNGDGGGRFL